MTGLTRKPARLQHHLGLLLATLLAGCATYQPLPLPDRAATAGSIQQLAGAADVREPLDIDAVQHLVLLNNPDLHTRFARHAAARAQAAQASALPNPTLAGSIGYLLSGVGDATAWTASISQDVGALITLKPRRESARAYADAVDASLLWEAWQTLGKARLLSIDIVEETRQLELQRTAVAALEQRAQQLRAAVAAGNLERNAIAPDLSLANDAHVAMNDLQQQLLDNRLQLAALMNLSPNAELPLIATLTPSGIDANDLERRQQHIAANRPDLIALQLGYQAQEASVHAAVLAQFPALVIGYDASQDNSRVRNGGPAISMELPLFDRHRNAVNEGMATRQQLHDEYIARLAAAHDEIQAIALRHQQLLAQRDIQARAMDEDQQAAQRANAAVHAGQLDLRSGGDLQLAALNHQTSVLVLNQRLLEQEAALDVLLGRGMPATITLDPPAP